jgi:nicotinamidase-related amidase
LLALDLQCDFLQPKGRLPIDAKQVPKLIDTMNRSIRATAARGWPVIYVVNAFETWDVNNLFRNFAALKSAPGGRTDPRIIVVPGAPTFEKRSPDAFTNTAFADRLSRLHPRKLVIGGVYADACVTATALGGLRRGYRVAVLADGVGAGSQAARQGALAKLRLRGVEIAQSVL